MNGEGSTGWDRWAIGGLWLALAVLLGLSGFALPVALLIVLPAGAGAILLHRLEIDLAVFPPRPDWLGRSILSGFVGSAAMMGAFIIAFGGASLFGTLLAGGQRSASGVMMGAWFFNLAHNVVTDMAQRSLYITVGVHFAFGMVFALLYGRYLEQRISGPDWARGLLWGMVPWVFSVTVFFPLIGAGFFGSALGAGPLPLLGNLLLHAVFGVTLGIIYGPLGDRLPGDEWEADAMEVEDMQHAEAGASKGIVAGVLLGIGAGAVAAGFFPQFAPTGPAEAGIAGMALMGGAIGALLGSLMSLPGSGRAPAHR